MLLWTDRASGIYLWYLYDTSGINKNSLTINITYPESFMNKSGTIWSNFSYSNSGKWWIIYMDRSLW